MLTPSYLLDAMGAIKGCDTVHIGYHFARSKSSDRVRVRRDSAKELKGHFRCFLSICLAWSDAITLNVTNMVESAARL